jgi:hypothetical protein
MTIIVDPRNRRIRTGLEMIDYVKNELTLPRLTLRVYMADHHPSGQGVTPFGKKITKEQGTTILKTYTRIPSPVSKLGGLNKSFAHFASSFSWTTYGSRHRRKNPDYIRQQMDQRAEQLVMGVDYNSVLFGKKKEKKQPVAAGATRLV